MTMNAGEPVSPAKRITAYAAAAAAATGLWVAAIASCATDQDGPEAADPVDLSPSIRLRVSVELVYSPEADLCWLDKWEYKSGGVAVADRYHCEQAGLAPPPAPSSASTPG